MKFVTTDKERMIMPQHQLTPRQTLFIPSLYEQALIRRIIAITSGKDTWSEAMAAIRLALNTPADGIVIEPNTNAANSTPNMATIPEEMQLIAIDSVRTLLSGLRQPFDYIDDEARDMLATHFDPEHSNIVALSQAKTSLTLCGNTHRAALPAAANQGIEALIQVYADYLQALTQADPVTRLDLLTPKAQISGVDIGFHYIPLEIGYTLVCRTRFGDKVKTNISGGHAVASLGGVHYKPAPAGNMDPIQPNAEHRSTSLHQLAAVNQVAAATTAIKVKGLPLWEIPAPDAAPTQSREHYQRFSERLRQQSAATLLASDPELASQLVIEKRPAMSVLIQAGYTIPSVCLLEVMLLRASINYMLRTVGQINAEAIIDSFLMDGRDFSEITHTLIPTLANAQNRDQEAEALFLAYRAQAQDLPENARLEEFATGGESGQRSIFYDIYNLIGRESLIQFFGLLHQYPALMAGQSLYNWLRLPKLIQSVLPELIAPCTGSAACAQIPHIFSTLDEQASSELMFGVLIGLATDGKFDNYRLYIEKNSQGLVVLSYIVLVDGDQGAKLPILVEKNPNSLEITMKISLLFISEFMELSFHPAVRERLLSQSADHWLVGWVQQLGLRDLACERWILQEGVTKQDTHDSAGMQIVDMPFRISPSVVNYMLRKLRQLWEMLASTQQPLTHTTLFATLYPEVHALYQQVAATTQHPYEAEKQIYRRIGPRVITTAQAWQAISQMPFDTALQQLPDSQVVGKERSFLVRSVAKRFAEEIAWHRYGYDEQLQLIEALVAVFPKISLPFTASELQQLLQYAVPKGYIATVTWLLTQGVAIEPKDNVKNHHSNLAALTILCRQWFEYPGPISEMLTLLLQAGARPNGYSPRGYTPLLELLNAATDEQAALIEPIIEQLCQAGAILDLPAAKSIAFPLDNLMKRRMLGNPNPGMPQLFALLVKLGGRRLDAKTAVQFMQTHADAPGMQEAYTLLVRDNMSVRWLIESQLLWATTSTSSSTADTIGQCTRLGGETAYLHPNLAPLLLDENQQFRVDPATDEPDGRRTVKKINVNINGQHLLLHAKRKPELPGIGFSVWRLSEPLSGGGIVPGELIAFYDPLRRERYPVLITPTMQGYNLDNVLKDPKLAAEILPKLVPEAISSLIILSILFNFEDGKPKNYMVIPSTRYPGMYEIVSIDYDHALIPASYNGELQVKNVLFCLDNMKDSINPTVVAQYLAFDIDALLEQWLNDVDIYHQDIQETFSTAETLALLQLQLTQMLRNAVNRGNEELPIVLRMPFRAKSIAWLYEKLLRLQTTLRENPTISHMDLLHVLEPQIGPIYKAEFDINPNPYARFRGVIAKSQGYLITLHGEITITTSKDITKFMGVSGSDLRQLARGDERFDTRYAKSELARIQLEHSKKKDVKKSLLTGDARPFMALLLDETKANIVKKINFSGIILADGTPDLIKQTALLKQIILAKVQFRRLHITHCDALTDELLTELLKHSYYVTRINLSGCVKLTNHSLNTIARFAPTLESLNLSGLPRLSQFQFKKQLGNSLVFLRLRHLNLSDCNALTMINIEPPALQHLRINEDRALKQMSVNTSGLLRFDAAHTELPLQQLQTLLQNNPSLHNLDLTAVAHIQQLTFPPRLHTLHLNQTDVSFAVLVAYLMQNQDLAKLSVIGCAAIPPTVQDFLIRALPLRHQLGSEATSTRRMNATMTALRQLLLGEVPEFTFTDLHQPRALWWLALQVRGIKRLRIDVTLTQEDCEAFDRYLEQHGPLEELVLKHDVTSSRALENLKTLSHYANYHRGRGHSCKIALSANHDTVDESAWLQALTEQLEVLPPIDGIIYPWGTAETYEAASFAQCFAILPHNTIAIGYADGKISIWRRGNEQHLFELQGHDGAVTALAVTPSGLVVSGSADTTVKVWDLSQQRCITTLRGHGKTISALVIIHDTLLASASHDGRIRLWDLKTHNCLTVFTELQTGVHSLAKLSNHRFASGDEDTIRIWDAAEKQCIATISNEDCTVETLLALPSDRLAAGGDDRVLRIWDLTTQTCIARLIGHTGTITKLVQLPDGLIASASADHSIRLWDVRRQRCIAVLDGHKNSISALAVFPNGELISGGFDKTLHVWSHQSSTYAPLLPSQAWQALGMSVQLDEHQNLIINWPFMQTTETGNYAYRTNPATMLLKHLRRLLPDAVIPHNKHQLILSQVPTPQHWQTVLSTLFTQSIQPYDKPNFSLSCAYGIVTEPDTVASWIEPILARNPLLEGISYMTTAIPSATGTSIAVGRIGITALALLADGRLARALSNNTIELLHPRTQQRTILSGHTSAIQTLAVLTDARLASGTHHGQILLWNTQDGSYLGQLTGHSSHITALQPYAENNLASGAADGVIRLWDLTDNHCIAELSGHKAGILALTNLSSGLLASGSADSNIRLWDPNTSQCIATLQGHTDGVSGLIELSDGRLVSASKDGTLRLWDLTTHRCLTDTPPLTLAIHTLSLSPEGWLVGGLADGSIAYWDANNLQLLGIFKEHITTVVATAFMPGGRLISLSVMGDAYIWPRLALKSLDLTPHLQQRQAAAQAASSSTDTLSTSIAVVAPTSSRRGYHTTPIWNPWHDVHEEESGVFSEGPSTAGTSSLIASSSMDTSAIAETSAGTNISSSQHRFLRDRARVHAPNPLLVANTGTWHPSASASSIRLMPKDPSVGTSSSSSGSSTSELHMVEHARNSPVAVQPRQPRPGPDLWRGVTGLSPQPQLGHANTQYLSEEPQSRTPTCSSSDTLTIKPPSPPRK
jgi:WD40 repeat protein